VTLILLVGSKFAYTSLADTGIFFRTTLNYEENNTSIQY